MPDQRSYSGTITEGLAEVEAIDAVCFTRFLSNIFTAILSIPVE